MESDSAPDGPAALRMIELHQAAGRPYELVLLDAQMPEMNGFDVAVAIQAAPGSGAPAIMMLSSVDLGTDAAHCREVGIRRYLVKPVIKGDLQAAILQVLGKRGPSAPPESAALARADGPALRILLAEDNPVNERLAVRLLEKRGHIVRSVHNGIEVLEVLRQQAFDVILMDVQMPGMDGIQCARTIRANGEATMRIPIIALTAHAMQSDIQMCLDAGMDDYVSKPIARSDLWRALGRVGRRETQLHPLPSSGDDSHLA